jgi:hypothetical protein
MDVRERLYYRHVEAALAGLMSVNRKSMGAFRAKLRHLRNIGVPQLTSPNPGSGRPIEYSRRHALELMIALELEKLGQSPRNVALNAPSIVGQSPYGQYEGQDCYVVIRKDEPGYTMTTEKGFPEFMRKAPDVFMVINVSGCVRRLDAALDHVLG